jgi:hypothetical protein
MRAPLFFKYDGWEPVQVVFCKAAWVCMKASSGGRPPRDRPFFGQDIAAFIFRVPGVPFTQ